MTVIRLTGHFESTGALELLRLFFGTAWINPDGSLQGGENKPMLCSVYEVLANGEYRVTTRIEQAASEAVAGEDVSETTTKAEAEAEKRPPIAARREIKRQLYTLLSEVTGRSFPYGSLTGVRPTRLAADELAAGRSAESAERSLIDAYQVAPAKARLLVTTAVSELLLLNRLPVTQPLIYLNIPFCPSHCSYCSFSCGTVAEHKIELDDYVNGMIAEIKQLGPWFKNPASAVYLGGGTPTTLSALQLQRLLSAVVDELPLAANFEFTVEAGRADTIDPEKLNVMRAAGVSRICLNPQTLHDKTLQRIGRRHSSQDWYKAYMAARSAGFSTINADLIAGLPAETAADFLASLNALIAAGPENITIHTLAYKRKSELTRNLDNDVMTTTDNNQWESALSEANERLISADYQPYYLYRQKDMIGGLENTGYARPGTACLYNVGMMSDERAVIGIGAGAMSKYFDARGWLQRLPAPRDPKTWLRNREDITKRKLAKLF